MRRGIFLFYKIIVLFYVFEFSLNNFLKCLFLLKIAIFVLVKNFARSCNALCA